MVIKVWEWPNNVLHWWMSCPGNLMPLQDLMYRGRLQQWPLQHCGWTLLDTPSWTPEFISSQAWLGWWLQNSVSIKRSSSGFGTLLIWTDLLQQQAPSVCQPKVGSTSTTSRHIIHGLDRDVCPSFPSLAYHSPVKARIHRLCNHAHSFNLEEPLKLPEQQDFFCHFRSDIMDDSLQQWHDLGDLLHMPSIATDGTSSVSIEEDKDLIMKI